MAIQFFTDDADIADAVCAGFCMYQFARRVGEFLKTRPDKYWLGTVAQVADSNTEGAPQAPLPCDSRGRPLDLKMAVDPLHSGHASVSSAMHYQRPSTQVVRPLDTVWKDVTRYASDHRDLVRTMSQNSNVNGSLQFTFRFVTFTYSKCYPHSESSSSQE